MKNNYKLGVNFLFVCFSMLFSFSVFGQVTLTATAGTTTGSFTTISDAFVDDNLEMHFVVS